MKKNKAGAGFRRMVHLNLPKHVVEAIDSEVERRKIKGLNAGRATIINEAVTAYLETKEQLRLGL